MACVCLRLPRIPRVPVSGFSNTTDLSRFCDAAEALSLGGILGGR